MQHTLTPLSPDYVDNGQGPVFNVLIAYEDFATGKHAKRTYDFLVDQLGRDCQFHNFMWKFDVLRIPRLREIASADASVADFIVISCHGTELPSHVRTWLDSAIQPAEPPLALVLLSDRAGEENDSRAAEVRSYLSQFARRWSMEFFAQPDEWPSKTQEVLPNERALGGVQRRALKTLAGALIQDRPTPRFHFSD